LALRAAIAARHQDRSGQPVTADNVIVLGGTQNSLFVASLCLAGPGDEIIALDPMYATYPATIRASGAKLVPVATPAARDFQIFSGGEFGLGGIIQQRLFYARHVFLPAVIGERCHVVENQAIVLSVEFRGVIGISAAPRGAVIINQFTKRGVVTTTTRQCANAADTEQPQYDR